MKTTNKINATPEVYRSFKKENEDNLREAREKVERKFLVTHWCPILPGLAVVVPLPRKIETESEDTALGSESQNPPKKKLRSTKFVAYKLWLIRISNFQKASWCVKALDKGAELFEKIDSFKFLVNLSRLPEENQNGLPNTISGAETPFDFFKRVALNGLKIAWHPKLLKLYLIYSPKLTTVIPVKKILSSEALVEQVHLNPALPPQPLKITNTQSSNDKTDISSVPTIYSIGISVGDSIFRISTINSITYTTQTVINDGIVILPSNVYWIFDEPMCSEGENSDFPKDGQSLLPSQLPKPRKLENFAFLLNSNNVKANLKSIEVLPRPILIVQSSNGDLHLCVSGQHLINTISLSDIFQDAPSQLNLVITSNKCWEILISNHNKPSEPPRIINLESRVSFESINLMALYQKTLRELSTLRASLEGVWRDLQAHSLLYQSQVRNLSIGTDKEASPTSPTSMLRTFFICGLMTRELRTFLLEFDLANFELWMELYSTAAAKIKSMIENTLIEPLVGITRNISFIESRVVNSSKRCALKMASQSAYGLHIRSQHLHQKLEQDLSQFKPFLQSLMDVSSILNDSGRVSELPPPNNLVLAFLDRANCAGPTLDLQSFFVYSAGSQSEDDSDPVSALIEGLEFFHDQAIELLFNPIENHDATLPQLYNDILVGLKAAKISYNLTGPN